MVGTELAPLGARPWPADRVERWPIERLTPYANNARLHSAADLDKIAASIVKWGWTNPVLVDEEGVLIAGHGRVAAAPRAGVRSIPVIVARGWSEAEKRAYRLADNQLAARAEWDLDRCAMSCKSSGLPILISAWSASSRVSSKPCWPAWGRVV